MCLFNFLEWENHLPQDSHLWYLWPSWTVWLHTYILMIFSVKISYHNIYDICYLHELFRCLFLKICSKCDLCGLHQLRRYVSSNIFFHNPHWLYYIGIWKILLTFFPLFLYCKLLKHRNIFIFILMFVLRIP